MKSLELMGLNGVIGKLMGFMERAEMVFRRRLGVKV